jgi:hypothetical protein
MSTNGTPTNTTNLTATGKLFGLQQRWTYGKQKQSDLATHKSIVSTTGAEFHTIAVTICKQSPVVPHCFCQHDTQLTPKVGWNPRISELWAIMVSI